MPALDYVLIGVSHPQNRSSELIFHDFAETCSLPAQTPRRPWQSPPTCASQAEDRKPQAERPLLNNYGTLATDRIRGISTTKPLTTLAEFTTYITTTGITPNPPE
ncbi:hypothetical protein [Rhodococcus koreensis]